MHHTSLIAILVAGFVLAFIFGMIAQRLRLSPLVGYLIAGIIAGPFTPGFVGDQTLAPQLAEIGVILLMFGVGLHFSLGDLLEVKAIALPGAILQIVVATALGWGMAWYLGWSHGAGLVFGLALSVASTVVLLRALEERRLVETAKGRIAVGWLIVEDLAMVLALVLLPALSGLLKGEDTEGSAIWSQLFVTLAKVGAFVAFMLIVGRRVIPWILERVAGTGSRELFTLCVLAIALGVAFGSAELFGVSFALGAFFAGMMLNESEFSHQAANETLPLRDAFAVLFFVSVGMLFNPMILIEEPLEVLAVFAIIVLGKSAAAYALVRAFGKPNSTALMISASLAQIGEFSFILATLGIELKILPKEGQDLILAGALMSIVVNPLLFAWLDRKQAREAAALQEAQIDPVIAPVPADIDKHVILIGYGRVGSELARLLTEHGVPLVVIDGEDSLIAKARAAGLPAILGNAVNERVLREAVPERATTVMLAIPQALEAGEIIAKLREINPALSIVARAHSDNEVRHLIQHGADGAVMAERELAHSLAEMVLAAPVYRGDRHLPPSTALV
ncbi:MULTISPECIES: YbaL family putative K(+) efflux transporter [Lysobacter]|jgi:CPA2 family monovalent cation:H+ antiporter-2|uniref:Kef family K(+) transporter n=1 Tax=Lysobacter gummosus TaxID=262324 RepID=A0ABY3X7D8_9GAMM|nr:MULTISPECIES: YbaL family putative K(+) efflux transporter [Lysobacter]ALN92946.1 proton antiporter-2 family protein [Lysobacter gummosus]UJB20260.1 Kef family K(+) transporter [Lysobacter capsici]UJQ30626.1 Kef family K(+) transporter [Lysobacter gummosus]UNP28488.1 Kef family K(+) transporter [Lysobacter gummosus]